MRGILVSILFISMAACQPNEERSEARIQAAVDENLQQREDHFFRKCRREAIERASYIVDSLMLEQAMSLGRGDEFAPPRPERPNLARPELSPDSTPLAPLFRKDSIHTQPYE